MRGASPAPAGVLQRLPGVAVAHQVERPDVRQELDEERSIETVLDAQRPNACFAVVAALQLALGGGGPGVRSPAGVGGNYGGDGNQDGQ